MKTYKTEIEQSVEHALSTTPSGACAVSLLGQLYEAYIDKQQDHNKALEDIAVVIKDMAVELKEVIEERDGLLERFKKLQASYDDLKAEMH